MCKFVRPDFQRFVCFDKFVAKKYVLSLLVYNTNGKEKIHTWLADQVNGGSVFEYEFVKARFGIDKILN